MTALNDELLWLVREDAIRRMAALANQYVHAKPQDRELLQAGLDFERWLAETCQQCLN